VNFLLRKSLLYFRLPKVPAHGEKEKKDFRREAVMQVSNGNILLQNGCYVTKDAIETEKKDLFRTNAYGPLKNNVPFLTESVSQ